MPLVQKYEYRSALRSAYETSTEPCMHACIHIGTRACATDNNSHTCASSGRENKGPNPGRTYSPVTTRHQ